MAKNSRNYRADDAEQGPGTTHAGSDLDNDESALFRSAVGNVAHVPNPRRTPSQATPSPKPQMREADERAVIDELLDTPPPPDIETGDELVYAREGVQHRVLKKLRRGQYRCQDELDLHGMVVNDARETFAAFLQEAVAAGYGCVRIIHGKGNRSGHRGPVLKTRVAGWLRQRDEVLAFSSTPANDGGTGAVYVLLRSR